jgi:tetratricopeptide (TPR) repeat protein
MRVSSERTHWLKGLVGFALDGDVSEEIARQEGALASDPGSAKPHFNLGVLHYSQGRVYEAIGEFLMAIELDPSYGRAYRKLGEIYVGLGDYRQAGRYALKAADFGDASLLEAFRRYSAMQAFVNVEVLESEVVEAP